MNRKIQNEVFVLIDLSEKALNIKDLTILKLKCHWGFTWQLDYVLHIQVFERLFATTWNGPRKKALYYVWRWWWLKYRWKYRPGTYWSMVKVKNKVPSLIVFILQMIYSCLISLLRSDSENFWLLFLVYLPR